MVILNIVVLKIKNIKRIYGIDRWTRLVQQSTRIYNHSRSTFVSHGGRIAREDYEIGNQKQKF